MEIWLKDAREALIHRRSSLRARGVQSPPPASLLSERDHRELRDIEDALARIQAGEFGRCSRCGGAMGHQRMRAIPEARYCLTCSAQVARCSKG